MPNVPNRPHPPGMASTRPVKLPVAQAPPAFQVRRTPPAVPRAVAGGRPPGGHALPAAGGRAEPARLSFSQVMTAQSARRVSAAAGGTEIGSLEVRAATGAAEVVNLKVKPEYRHQGAGAALIAEAARAAAKMGRARVTLEAQDSGSGRLVSWYRRLGFVPTGKSSRGYTTMAAPVALLRRQPPREK